MEKRSVVKCKEGVGEEGRWARRRVRGDIVMIEECGVGESKEARGKEK